MLCWQFLCHVLKALFFITIALKLLFLQKNAKFSSAGDSAPRPAYLRRVGALLPNPQPLAAEGSPPDPKIAPSLQISGYAPSYILLHHFNVLGYSSTSITIYCDIRMFLLLPIFCCHFLLIYLFVTAKAATASCSEEAFRFRRRNVKPINILIVSTKWFWITIPINATRLPFSLKTRNCYDIG